MCRRDVLVLSFFKMKTRKTFSESKISPLDVFVVNKMRYLKADLLCCSIANISWRILNADNAMKITTKVKIKNDQSGCQNSLENKICTKIHCWYKLSQSFKPPSVCFVKNNFCSLLSIFDAGFSWVPDTKINRSRMATHLRHSCEKQPCRQSHTQKNNLPWKKILLGGWIFGNLWTFVCWISRRKQFADNNKILLRVLKTLLERLRLSSQENWIISHIISSEMNKL